MREILAEMPSPPPSKTSTDEIQRRKRELEDKMREWEKKEKER
jgi:hypothetical protein